MMSSSGPFSVVVSDFRMPGMNGMQLIAELKRLRPAMPVVLISGWSVPAAGYPSQRPQPDGLLSKPVSSSQLAATLVQVMHATR